MGNLSYISSPRKLNFEEVDRQIHEINNRRFGGFFRIENEGCMGYSEGWLWYVPNPPLCEYPLFGKYITETKRKIAGGHPRPGLQWAYWVLSVFENELGALWKGTLSDDGVNEKWAPIAGKFPTFDNYVLEGFPNIPNHILENFRNEVPEGLVPYAFTEDQCFPSYVSNRSHS